MSHYTKSIDVVNPKIYATEVFCLPNLVHCRYSNCGDDIRVRRKWGGTKFIAHSLSITCADPGVCSSYFAATYARMLCYLACSPISGMPVASDAYIRI